MIRSIVNDLQLFKVTRIYKETYWFRTFLTSVRPEAIHYFKSFIFKRFLIWLASNFKLLLFTMWSFFQYRFLFHNHKNQGTCTQTLTTWKSAMVFFSEKSELSHNNQVVKMRSADLAIRGSLPCFSSPSRISGTQATEKDRQRVSFCLLSELLLKLLKFAGELVLDIFETTQTRCF